MKKKSSLWILMMMLAVALAFGGCSGSGSVSGDGGDTQKEQRDRGRGGKDDDKSDSKQEDDKKDAPNDEGSEDQQPGSAADDRKGTSNDDESEDQQPGNVTDDKSAQGSEENQLVGTWVSDPIDALTQEFLRGMGDLKELEEYITIDASQLQMGMRFVFDEGGKMSASLDEEGLNGVVDYALNIMVSVTKIITEEELASRGLDMSADEFLAAQGTSWDDILEGARKEVYSNIDTNSMGQEGVYEVRDGRIFIASTKAELAYADSMSFEISGDKLTFIAYYNGDGEMEEDSVWGGVFELPLVFHRQ